MMKLQHGTLIIRTQILINHMKRAKEEYTTATNGLEALHKYQAEHQSIKVIFMGRKIFSYPVFVHTLVLLKCMEFKCSRALSGFFFFSKAFPALKLSIVPARDGR